jgi:hypothetical protein
LNRALWGICGRIIESLRGNFMGREARIGLLLAGTCCLLAVMVEWVVDELGK